MRPEHNHKSLFGHLNAAYNVYLLFYCFVVVLGFGVIKQDNLCQRLLYK